VTRPIRSSEPASDEFREAVRWYEARRAGLGGEFFDTVAETLARIEANPEIGTTISADGQTRRALLVKFPYQVVYRLRPTEIVIVAIAHLKRRPGTGRTEVEHRVRPTFSLEPRASVPRSDGRLARRLLAVVSRRVASFDQPKPAEFH